MRKITYVFWRLAESQETSNRGLRDEKGTASRDFRFGSGARGRSTNRCRDREGGKNARKRTARKAHIERRRLSDRRSFRLSVGRLEGAANAKRMSGREDRRPRGHRKVCRMRQESTKKARKKKLANSEVASLNNIRMRHACIDQTAEHSRHSQCSPSEASDVDARLFG